MLTTFSAPAVSCQNATSASLAARLVLNLLPGDEGRSETLATQTGELTQRHGPHPYRIRDRRLGLFVRTHQSGSIRGTIFLSITSRALGMRCEKSPDMTADMPPIASK